MVISNDLLINWGGSSATGNRTVTFPQTFKKFRSITATAASSVGTMIVTVMSYTYADCNFYPNDTSRNILIYWIAIGK